MPSSINWLKLQGLQATTAIARQFWLRARKKLATLDVSNGAPQERSAMLRSQDRHIIAGLIESDPAALKAALEKDRALVESTIAYLIAERPTELISAIGASREFGNRMVGDLVNVLRNSFQDALSAIDPIYMERALSFSQEGEDLIVARMLNASTPGFFVDVGAYHPFRFSNTYLLYKRGWRGINIDAAPGAMEAFNAFRPKDVNLETFVGRSGIEHKLALFNEPALNTASSTVLTERELPPESFWQVGEAIVRGQSLAEILDKHMPPSARFDLLDVDVEGAEQEVLESNDWARFRPKIILIEQLETDLAECLSHPTGVFLTDKGYRLAAKAFNTSFFERKDD